MGAVKVIVVAGTSSGVGKTTVAVGLMAALRCRGYRVQPFKVGPDFFDPMHHKVATGKDSINLDGWLMNEQQNIDAFNYHCQDCDIAIVEGVMGLFDGTDGQTEQGSTAQMAKWLRATVVLVLECSSVARSIAAMVKGYQSFDKDLAIGGVILNKVAGQAHASSLQESIQRSGLPTVVLGGLPKNSNVDIQDSLPAWLYGQSSLQDQIHIQDLSTFMEQHVNMEALLKAAAIVEVPTMPPIVLPPPQRRVKVAVAKDNAFCFYYQQNLALLERAGAQLVPFSLVEDTQLPAGAAAVLIGGGHPEHHTKRLCSNWPMLMAMKAFSNAGGVVYAECAGLMYLSQSLELEDGTRYPMVGLFPFRTRIAGGGRIRTGYVDVDVQPGCRHFPAGSRIRGHVYHYSEIVEEHVVSTLGSSPASSVGRYMYSYQAQMLSPSSTWVPEGYSTKNTLGSFVHLHWGSAPSMAHSFVELCWGVDVEGAHVAAHTAASRAPSPRLVNMQHAAQALPGEQPVSARLAQAAHHSRCSMDSLLPGSTHLPLAAHYPRLSMDSKRLDEVSHKLGSAGLDKARNNSSSFSIVEQHTGLGGQPLSEERSAYGTTGDEVSKPGHQPRAGSDAGSPRHVPSGKLDAHTTGHTKLGHWLSDHPCRLSSTDLSDSSSALLAAMDQPNEGCSASACASPRCTDSCPDRSGWAPDDSQGVLSPASRAKSGVVAIAQQLLAAPEALLHLAHTHASSFHMRKSRSMNGVGGAEDDGAGQLTMPGSSGSQLSAANSASRRRPWGASAAPPATSGHHKSASMQHLSDLAWPWGPGLPPAGPTAPVPGPAGAGLFKQRSSGSDETAAAAVPGAAALRSKLLERRAVPLSSMAGVAKGASVATSGAGPAEGPRSQPELEEVVGRHSRSSSDSRHHSTSPFGRGSNDSIVSFSPSVTAMLVAMGLGSRLAGVTELCTLPADQTKSGGVQVAVKSRRPVHDDGGNSWLGRMHKSELESWVSQLRQQGLGLYRINDDFLRQERPGLVVIQESCELYHPEKFTVQKALERAGLLHPDSSTAVLQFSAHNLSDVLEFVLLVGQSAGAPEAGAMLTERLRTRLRRVAAAVVPRSNRPRLMCLHSVKPLVEAGRWLPEMARLAGATIPGHIEVGDAPTPSTWQSIEAFAPEVLLFSHPLQSMECTLMELAEMAALPGWWNLPAVKSGQVYVLHPSLLARPGPGLVDGVELLARICHPGSVKVKLSQGMVLKLSLQGGQRCRSRLLPNYFMPFL